MFWDKVSALYDLFENIYNGKVNRMLCKEVEDIIDESDIVLECACGTGMLSTHIGRKCRKLIATDYSEGMLRQAKRKCRALPNVTVKKADIMHLKCKDARFDKVVAGNVIHLLDNPVEALKELERVCKPSGKIIIPTYVNIKKTGKLNILVSIFDRLGADFKKQFDFNTYKDFFKKAGYKQIEYRLVEGRMPCAIAIITKQ